MFDATTITCGASYYLNNNKKMRDTLAAHNIEPTRRILFKAIQNAIVDAYDDILGMFDLSMFSDKITIHINLDACAVIYRANGKEYARRELLTELCKQSETIYNDMLCAYACMH